MQTAGFNIAAVERDTGLSKDVLRMWERRYGFPSPQRDAHGERSYPVDQVERLRTIKRLMDQGHRPGKLIGASTEELATLAPRRAALPAATNSSAREALDDLLALIRQHDANRFLHAMQQRLAREGLLRFVHDTVAPLTRLVGEAWERGQFEIYEEHLFSELTKRLLRQAIATLPIGQRQARILLTSVPDEPHILGLLMVEAVLSLEGAQCIPLGTEMPLLDIARAAKAHRADVLALSFSMAFPQRQISGSLRQLRELLPPGIALWAGGAGVSRLEPIEGVVLLATLDDAMGALANLCDMKSGG
jgi:DNA-binding transcriptional MerR regulator/methylmalonyl-CoA mutase cobalamin-binding subunit